MTTACRRFTAPGEGHDVVVVTSLKESTSFNYEIGFPRGGNWREEINSDVYDNWVNPWVVGNGGGVVAVGGGMHGLSFGARITSPANSILFPGKRADNKFQEKYLSIAWKTINNSHKKSCCGGWRDSEEKKAC